MADTSSVSGIGKGKAGHEHREIEKERGWNMGLAFYADAFLRSHNNLAPLKGARTHLAQLVLWRCYFDSTWPDSALYMLKPVAGSLTLDRQKSYEDHSIHVHRSV